MHNDLLIHLAAAHTQDHMRRSTSQTHVERVPRERKSLRRFLSRGTRPIEPAPAADLRITIAPRS
jgi:hypothetical protein